MPSGKPRFLNSLLLVIATFGLGFWALLLCMSAFINGGKDTTREEVNTSLFFVLQLSGLFLAFPLIANLITAIVSLILGSPIRRALLYFAHKVLFEFGLFWGFLVLGYALL